MTGDRTAAEAARPALPLALRAVLLAWLVLSVAFFIGPVLMLGGFHYPEAWVSAHFATIGRAFVDSGIIGLAGVPVQNNLPLTTAPDIYINWPPLYGYAMAGVMQLFGSSETVVHLFACAVTLTIAGLIFAIASWALGTAAGLVGAAVFLNAPIIATSGHMASQLTFSLALLLAALFCLQLARAPRTTAAVPHATVPLVCAGVFFVLAVATSWEPVLAAPVLCAHALLCRDRKAFGVGLLCGALGLVTVALVMVLYFMSYPEYFEALMTRLRLRAGFDVSYDPAVAEVFANPHFLQERNAANFRPTHFDALKAVAARFGNIGVLGMGALIALFCLRCAGIRQPGAIVLALAVPLGIFALWTLLMPHHMAIHAYQILLVAPMSGLAAAALAATPPAGDIARHGTVAAWVAVAVMLTGFAYRAEETWRLVTRSGVTAEASFLQELAQILPEDAILLYLSPDMVPVYYAERHVIRFVTSDADLREIAGGLESLCPECSFFLLVPDWAEERFRSSLAAFPVFASSAFGQVVQVDPASLN